MVPLLTERDRIFFHQGIHIVLKVACKILNRPRHFFDVCVVDASYNTQSIVEEMRLNLPQHNIHFKLGVFNLLAVIAFCMICKDQKIHRQCRDNCGQHNKIDSINKNLEKHSDNSHSGSNPKRGGLPFTQFAPALDQQPDVYSDHNH